MLILLLSLSLYLLAILSYSKYFYTESISEMSRFLYKTATIFGTLLVHSSMLFGQKAQFFSHTRYYFSSGPR